MSTASLNQSILQGGIYWNSFFNGRLLSGEDMTKEQADNLEARKRLGKAVGEGVASGLEVAQTPGSPVTAPTVTVTKGLAVNRCGRTLALTEDTDVLLIRPKDESTTAPATFDDCEPAQPGVYVSAGAGVYLLTIAPAEGTDGRAPVSGLGNIAATCNTRYTVEGVQFRLLSLTACLTSELTDLPHLRNRIASRCFGMSDANVKTFISNPFGTVLEGYGLLDGMRPDTLTNCDVPLALIYWTDSGIQFVDMWSVRRRLIDPNTAQPWGIEARDRRVAEAFAMFLQFQDHLNLIYNNALGGTTTPASQMTADQSFVWLPPAGYLPTGTGGFDWKTFLGPLAPLEETSVDEGLIRSIVRRSFFEDPVDIKSFTDWEKPSSLPPDPLHIYQIPGNSSFVVFSRSKQGRLRVFLSPTPASGAAVDVHATNAATNTEWQSVSANQAMYVIDDLASGSYDVAVDVQNYISTSLTAELVDGQTTDISPTLQPLPNGSLLLAVQDGNGHSIGSSVGSVTADSHQGSVHPGNYRSTDDRWIVSDLPSNNYDVTVVASNYKTGTLTGVPVPVGQQIQRTITLIRSSAARPLLCIQVESLKKPLLAKGRICLMLGCTKSGSSKTEGNIFWTSREDVDTSASAKEQEKRKQKVSSNDHPWDRMILIQTLPSNVQQWLADWKDWFSKEYPNQGIEDSTPAIYLNPEYLPPMRLQDVPSDPQGYAVFGEFCVPLSITPSSRMTKVPVELKKARAQGTSDKVLEALKKCGIIYVDQIPGLWTDYLQGVIEQSVDYWKYFVTGYIKVIQTINDGWNYYDDMTPELQQALQGKGWTDDVALANANRDDVAALKEVGDPGFANRLIQEAREVVLPEAWSLEGLGLTDSQIQILDQKGVSSKGEFVMVAQDATKAGDFAVSLGIPKSSIALYQSSAISQMTASSIQYAPIMEISMLSGVDALVADRMAKSNIFSVDDLGSKTPTELANATGLSEAAAASLVDQAKSASKGGMAIGYLAPVSAAEAKSLESNGIKSISQIAGMSAAEFNAKTGGKDLGRASAIVGAAKAALANVGMRG